MEQAEAQSYLFVGLGNPGADYAMTRHNMGYQVVQAFALGMGWSFKEDRRFNALVAKGMSKNKIIHLLLPLTYMNLSGTSIRSYIAYFKIPIHRLLIVVDDIALPFGQIRMKEMGSAGGHNGLKSVEAYLGTRHYMRLRMGVGHPGEKILADYVLEPFSPAEQKELQAFVDRGARAMQQLLQEGPTSVMNAINIVPKQVQQEPGKEPKDLTKPPLVG